MRWLILALWVGACSSPAPTCEQPAGVWRDGDGRRYQVTANQDGYEMYALFDSAQPPTGTKDAAGTRYAPIVFDLHLGRGAVEGRRSQRITRGAQVCNDRRSVRGFCQHAKLVLEYGAATTCRELGPLAPAGYLELDR